MAITKEKKGEIVAKVRDIAGKAKTLVFANFNGLTVAQQSEMRTALRGQGIGYVVAKKSLLRRAIEGMPEIEALRAQFVQLINSPLQRFAVVLDAHAKKLEAKN